VAEIRGGNRSIHLTRSMTRRSKINNTCH